MQSFVVPYIGQRLTELVHAQSNRQAEVADRLTIHLRADDIKDHAKFEWGQPPCSMYQRIILDHGFRNVLVVAKRKSERQRTTAACDSWLVEFGRKHQLNLSRSTGESLVEDFGSLLQAQNLVLSFSSFALSAALLSNDIRVMYRRRDAKWDSILQSILNCDVWPGVVMYEYNTTLQKKDVMDIAPTAGEWLASFPVEGVSGPFICRFGSEMQPEV